jgi:NAD(P)-dependent dehydrogenase (short-subunit alcohol dehydrogenase family)
VPSSDLLTSKFSRHSTADEVIDGISLSGRRAVVTGANSGIGVETARALASAGTEVTLAVRNVEADRRVATSIEESIGNPDIAVDPLELDDRGSVPRRRVANSSPRLFSML